MHHGKQRKQVQIVAVRVDAQNPYQPGSTDVAKYSDLAILHARDT
jgi:hypothetical protein